MPKARLSENFRGPWTPLVNTIAHAINIISESEGRYFEVRLFGLSEELEVRITGSWTRVRGVTFTLSETEFTKQVLTKKVETQLLLLGWRRSPTRGVLSYVYALHGKLRSDFLAGAIVDAVKLIGTDDPSQCFEIEIDGERISKMNSEFFEPCGSSPTRFKSKG